MKHCRRCDEPKPLSLWRSHSTYCNPCEAKRSREQRQKRKEARGPDPLNAVFVNWLQVRA